MTTVLRGELAEWRLAEQTVVVAGTLPQRYLRHHLTHVFTEIHNIFQPQEIIRKNIQILSINFRDKTFNFFFRLPKLSELTSILTLYSPYIF
jgi:hypothetical protein